MKRINKITNSELKLKVIPRLSEMWKKKKKIIKDKFKTLTSGELY